MKFEQADGRERVNAANHLFLTLDHEQITDSLIHFTTHVRRQQLDMHVYYWMGVYAVTNARYEEAVMYDDRALALAVKTGDGTMQSELLNEKAVALFRLSDFAQALSAAKACMESCRHSDDIDLKCRVQNTIAAIYVATRQPALTEALNDKADEDKDDDDDDEEEQKVKHNIFDSDEQTKNYLEHSDELSILEMAKSPNYGSFKAAVEAYENENDVTIMHDGISGFAQEGEGNVTYLFPEYKDVRSGAPELITNDQGWVDVVLKKVHKSPMSRIRTSHVDIRNIDELRAKGYKKGDKKAVTGNFKLVRRTTDPQTVYVRSNLHRDDIVDITDFDYVQYLYNIDRMNLNEEVATAILFGDGRDDGAADKIMPEHIRPIWTDDDLYTIHYDLDVAEAKKILQGNKTNDYFGENYVTAEAMVNACLYAREKSKGTGTPDMFIDPHMVNVMLLARDRNGRRIYASKAELAAALNVGNIYTVEQMADKTRVAGVGANAKVKKLHALIVNLNDYQVGSTKGGEITHFTQFDIDFNQQKSLLETRLSGANTKLWSAIAIEETIGDAPAAPVDDDLDNPVDDEF